MVINLTLYYIHNNSFNNKLNLTYNYLKKFTNQI